jgi:ABC-2 type transport system permease protein
LSVAGAVFGVAGAVASIGLGGSILGLTGIDPAFDSTETWLLAARMVLAMALWAVIGVGLGSLIPNQITSIVVVLAFTQFIEPILRLGTSVWEWTAHIGKFLPGAASDALVGSSIYSSITVGAVAVEPLEWWQGGLVLLAIGGVIAAAGWATTWRRDVT